MYRNSKIQIVSASKTVVLLAAMLVLAVSAHAQLEIGESTKISGNGSLGWGYGSSWSNTGTTVSNQTLVGQADFKGYYFHPNFLSFNFRPYYQRSQGDAESQTVFRSSGVGADASFFGGSRFPGAVYFGKDFSSDSQSRFAGVPSVSGNSSGQNFGVSWSAQVPDWPTLNASFSRGSSTASVDGTEPSYNASKNLNLNSSYDLLGWAVSGNFNHNIGTFRTPDFYTGAPIEGDSSSTSYGVAAGRGLPFFKGGVSLSWMHMTSNSAGGDWKTNSYTFSNSFIPWHRISVYQNASYTDDLAASYVLQQTGGVGLPAIRNYMGSHGMTYTAGASYNVFGGLNIGGQYTRRWQKFLGKMYEDEQYGGNLSYGYNHRFLGMIYFGLGVVDVASKVGNTGAGLSANAGMSKKFGHWDTSGDFNYSQSFQTIAGFGTTSNYTYGGSTHRKIIEDTQFGGSARFGHSGIVSVSGSGNATESFSGFMVWKKYHFAGGYSMSDGTAVFNTKGELTPITGAAELFVNNALLFDARSWSVSGSTILLHKINVTSSYSRFRSGTSQLGSSVTNLGNRFSVSADYRLRKFQILGYFFRTDQTVSTIPGGPRVINSFQMSISRWFNVF